MDAPSEEVEAAEIELRELRLVAARAEGRIACLHFHRLDKVLTALVESIGDCSKRAVATQDEHAALAHKYALDELVQTFLDVLRPGRSREGGGQ